MRKIVFFILLIIWVIPNNVNAKSVTNPCQSGEIEVSTNQTGGLNVVKRGPNPFISVIEGNEGKLYIRDFLCTDQNIILYGYTHIPENETYYEGYLIVLNETGKEIQRMVFDFGELEEVIEVVYFDHLYGVVINQLEYTQEPSFMMSYVFILDSEFKELSNYTYYEEIYEVEAKKTVLALRFLLQDQYDVGITSNLEEIYPNQVFDLEEVYQEPLIIPFINEAFINGVVYTNGVTISYPGNYELIYNKQIYHFVMEPNIIGVEDKGMYFEPVIIYVKEGNILLNGERYTNNTPITEPGYYQLIIEGASGYQKEISFTIGSMIQGLINGFEYQNPITISFTGQGFLNSNQVTSPIIIDQQGDYVFRVLGENGYSEEYHFNLNYEDKFDLVSFIQKIDIFIMVGVVITGVIIIKKSK